MTSTTTKPDAKSRSPKSPTDHLAVRTVIGQGRKKPPPFVVEFDDAEYHLPGKAPVGFIEVIADAAALELSDERTGMMLLRAFLQHVVPEDLLVALRADGDQDVVNELFAEWNKVIKTGESSGSTD